MKSLNFSSWLPDNRKNVVKQKCMCMYAKFLFKLRWLLIWTCTYLYLFELKYICIFLTNHCQQDLFQYLAANNFTFVKKNLKIQDKFYIFMYVGGMMVLILVMLKPMRTNFYLPIPIKCRSDGIFSNQRGTSLCGRWFVWWVGCDLSPWQSYISQVL